jgi:hypothetical protein
MRKFYIAAVIFGCMVFNGLVSVAQTAGFNNTFIILKVNGTDTYYDLNIVTGPTGHATFEGNNLGTFVSGTSNLMYVGAEHNVYKCGGCNITSTGFHYRIYPTGSPSGLYTNDNILFNSDFANGCSGRDQKWANTGGAVDLINGLAPGNYTLAVYSDLSSSCSGTIYASNSSNDYKATFTIAPNTWLGVTTSWISPSSWSALSVPTANAYVSIPVVGSTLYPTITSAQTCYNLDIVPGASLTLSSTTGAKLSLTGAITNTGLIDATVGTLELNGTTPQTIVNSVFKDKIIKNLIISNNVSLGGTANVDTFKITGTISFGASSKTFTTNNNLTLISNASGTAGIGDMTAGGVSGNTIVGNANVERYISAGRKWRFISINTEGSQTIQNSWMEKQAPGVQGPTGYGAWITDPAAANVDGLSYTPAMKYYNAGSYTSITDPTTFDIKSQPAYMAYIRGDRSATHLNATANETVLRTYGTLVQGQKTINIPAGTGTLAVIANPYAAAIDLKQLTYSNTGAIDIYVWDPKLGGAYTLGGYQVISRAAPGLDFKISSPGGGRYGGVTSPMNTIESGLAFYIKGNASAQTVTMNENAKTPSLNNVFFTAAQPKDVYSLLSVKDATGTTLIDGANASFDATFSNDVDDDDAIKFPNFSENVSFRRSSTLLAIERRMMPVANDTLFVNLTGLGIKNYQWTFKLSNMDAPGLTGFVKDNYLNTTTALNLNGDNVMDFSVTADAGSYAADRFMIILKPTAVVPVAMQIISAARQADKTVQVKWKADHETNVARYEAERSSNGITFNKVSTTLSTNSTIYAAADPQPLDGINYYRVKAVDVDGAAAYTEVVKVAAIGQSKAVTVNPNPVKDKTLHLQIESMPAGKYNLQLINAAGAIVYRQLLSVSGEVFTREIQLGKQAAAGSYRLILTCNDGKVSTLNIIIE